jgi:hypothetical protein
VTATDLSWEAVNVHHQLQGTLILLVGTIVAIELSWATRVMASFGALAAAGGRTQRVLRRRNVSEWAKEGAMRLLSKLLLGQSLRSACLLLIVASPFLVAMAVNTYVHIGIRHAYANLYLRAALLSLSLAYLVMRRSRRNHGAAAFVSHGGAERLWQRMALGQRAVVEVSFDIERARFSPWQDGTDQAAGHAPVFISGLARGGTTILTRLLHEHHGFGSLTYRDLPFPLAPNLWGAVSGRLRRHVERRQRGHGDGIEHDLDSAEAIEEVFWRHHEGPRYLSADGLKPVPPMAETAQAFRDYVGLVRRRYGGARYLSKNNANVLRLPALVAAFPRAVLLHPFRDPLQQACSLLNQHRMATDLARQDPFRRDFMRWLGHHEFGMDQRPFLFPGHPGRAEDRHHIDYWLKLWISVHDALLAQGGAVQHRQIFIDHDALCRAPDHHAGPLGAALGLAGPLATHGLRIVPPRVVHGADPALVERAMALHRRLQVRSQECRSVADCAA